MSAVTYLGLPQLLSVRENLGLQPEYLGHLVHLCYLETLQSPGLQFHWALIKEFLKSESLLKNQSGNAGNLRSVLTGEARD